MIQRFKFIQGKHFEKPTIMILLQTKTTTKKLSRIYFLSCQSDQCDIVYTITHHTINMYLFLYEMLTILVYNQCNDKYTNKIYKKDNLYHLGESSLMHLWLLKKNQSKYSNNAIFSFPTLMHTARLNLNYDPVQSEYIIYYYNRYSLWFVSMSNSIKLNHISFSRE